MKKLLSLFTFLIIFIGLQAAQFKNIYHKDYGVITRAVLVLDKKVSYNISPTKNTKNIEITLNNTSIHPGLSKKKIFESQNLYSAIMESENNQTIISINTQKPVSIKYYPLRGKEYKIVIDIFTTMQPKTLQEHLDFANFYYTVGYFNKAIEQYKIINNLSNKHSGINYYWGEILLKRKDYKSAYARYKNVLNTAIEFQKAHERILELEKRGLITISKNPKEKETQTTKKSNENNKEKNIAQASQSIPNNKQTKQKTPAEEKTSSNSDKNSTSGFEKNMEDSYISFFKKAKDNDEKLYLLGITAKAMGDYQRATEFFMGITEKFPKVENVYRELYEAYKYLGDEKNAKIYKSLLLKNEPNPQIEKLNFWQKLMKIKINLFFAILFAIVIAIMTFFATVLYYSRKKEEQLFDEEDLSYHEETLKASYQKQSIENPKNEEKSESPDLEETTTNKDENQPEEPVETPVGEKTKIENSENGDVNPFDLMKDLDLEEDIDYENPPIITEELTPEEDSELIEEEMNLFKETEDFDVNDDDVTGIGNDEYQKKMILKLAGDGWNIDEIAKELHISQNEVEFVLKTNE